MGAGGRRFKARRVRKRYGGEKPAQASAPWPGKRRRLPQPGEGRGAAGCPRIAPSLRPPRRCPNPPPPSAWLLRGWSRWATRPRGAAFLAADIGRWHNRVRRRAIRLNCLSALQGTRQAGPWPRRPAVSRTPAAAAVNNPGRMPARAGALAGPQEAGDGAAVLPPCLSARPAPPVRAARAPAEAARAAGPFRMRETTGLHAIMA